MCFQRNLFHQTEKVGLCMILYALEFQVHIMKNIPQSRSMEWIFRQLTKRSYTDLTKLKQDKILIGIFKENVFYFNQDVAFQVFKDSKWITDNMTLGLYS